MMPRTASFPQDKRPLAIAGLTLGIGMGGFVDGILFHQVLQLHNMISAKRPPDTLVNLEVAMVWDGVFHAATWTCTALGIALLFRAARNTTALWSSRLLLGAMLAGWGLFNLVEGTLDHHILHLHHVVERRGESIFDLAFLASGVLLLAAGTILFRTAQP